MAMPEADNFPPQACETACASGDAVAMNPHALILHATKVAI
jgi:hypothetical protein